MRRWVRAALLLIVALLSGYSSFAHQDDKINFRIPPPPPPPEFEPVPLPTWRPAPSLMPEALPVVSGTVEVPRGLPLEVVLETPLSTRIATQGQTVTFRLEKSIQVEGEWALPPGTGFHGTVVSAKPPGAFGRAGELRVRLDSMELAHGAATPVVARLESADLDAHGRASADNNRTANLLDLAQWTLGGTLMGREVSGGKGAAIGAGAGAAIALILLASRRGTDIYLEPGTPFTVILEEPVELPAASLYAAQRAYAQAQEHEGWLTATTTSSPSASEAENDTPSDRPRLKRRPRRSNP